MSKFWYQIQLQLEGEPYSFYGSSDHDEAAFITEMQEGRFVLLESLLYFDDQDRPRPWKEWNPNCLSRAYINPSQIMYVLPLIADPRGVEHTSSSKGVLQLPRSRQPQDE